MATSKRTTLILLALGCLAQYSRAQTLHGPNPSVQDVASWTDAEIGAWMQTDLDRGLPVELGDSAAVVARWRSATAVPLVEKKVEQVLASRVPAACFTQPGVDPKRFLSLATGFIEFAADESAIRAAATLVRIDGLHFSSVVNGVLLNANAGGPRNPFTVAYAGLELGDPVVARRINGWAESLFASEAKFPTSESRQRWAEAMLEKYGVVPGDGIWATDPIAIGLSRKTLESTRSAVTRLAAEVLEKRVRK